MGVAADWNRYTWCRGFESLSKFHQDLDQARKFACFRGYDITATKFNFFILSALT